MSDIIHQSFPRDELEALALLYVQQKGNLSPEAMLDLYQKAYDQMALRKKETQHERCLLGWSAK